ECTASSGVTALERLEQRAIHVVLLDVFMPDMDGIENLIEIKRRYKDLPVIIVSSGGEDGAKTTVTALEHGAMDYILKPAKGDGEKNISIISRHLGILFSQILMDQYAVSRHSVKKKSRLNRDKLLYRGKDEKSDDKNLLPQKNVWVNKRKPETQRPVSQMKKRSPLDIPPISPNSINGVDLVVIASSTGGPNAVEKVCQQLGSNFSKPILIVQHMPPDFTKIFAEFLSRKCEIEAKEAQEGDEIKGGNILVAQGGYHMRAVSGNEGRRKSIALDTTPTVNGVRPAADVLFESIAKSYRGQRILAVILTGMGSDGTKGVEALKKECQCYCITQSEETCVIYGMPRSVVEAGLSDEVVHLKDIGKRILDISGG
ncbi:MAG TPA: chemotaxis-specific protein-glutamate methyltransferase CheB, partial [Clostridia bacterium]|nr:chemotaxis-specific protein-glutamate methyltransferase CheB [Clostridia bacterium]